MTASASEMVLQAGDVAYVTADEAYHLLMVELDRFLRLVETLDREDWQRPTACTAWTVRDVVAHQAGGYASGTSYREVFRQVSAKRQPGDLIEDAINRLQVSERAGRSPAELIEELRRVGPVAARKWAYQFRLAKLVTMPHPVSGGLSLRHLMWVIHSRDTWMHRLDICRATGRDFEQTAEQDGRIVALVMQDVAKVLRRKLGDVPVLFELTGIAGGTWKTGSGQPAAAIRMDALDFNVFASGRYSYEEARARASLSGDIRLAEQVLQNVLVLY